MDRLARLENDPVVRGSDFGVAVCCGEHFSQGRGHHKKGLVDVRVKFGGTLQEGCAYPLCHFPPLCGAYRLFSVEVALVCDEHDAVLHVCIRVVLNLSHPTGHVLKAVYVGDVVNLL